MNDFYLIGLTGNLASGKSTVRRMLEQLGARGIDADLLAHSAMARGSRAWLAIVREFGLNVLKFNGEVDRQKLGERVFSNPAALERLEQISHPLVRQQILSMLRETDAAVVVIEAVKLIEAGLNEWCDAVWVVTCKPEIQVKRVMDSRQMTAEDARARLHSQGSLDEKIKRADFVIDNSKGEEETLARVKDGWNAIRSQVRHEKTAWLNPSPPIKVPAAEAHRGQALDGEPIPSPADKATGSAGPLPVWAKEPTERKIWPSQLELRRARKNDLNALSVAFAKRDHSPSPTPRAQTLARFGARGYRIATTKDTIMAFVAWEAENLVAVVREAWADSAEIAAQSLPPLFRMVEEEAKELQCEVLLLVVDPLAPPFIRDQARGSDFQPHDLQELHPVWRQVAYERVHSQDEIWVKRLREDLVSQPF